MIHNLIFIFKNKRIKRDVDIRKIINKIDYITSFCLDEYEHLTSVWGGMPQFVQMPISQFYDEQCYFRYKTDKIILGNKIGLNFSQKAVKKLNIIKLAPQNFMALPRHLKTKRVSFIHAPHMLQQNLWRIGPP